MLLPAAEAWNVRLEIGSFGSVTGIVTVTLESVVVTGPIVPITGGLQTGVTVNLNVREALVDPSLTVIVTFAIPLALPTRLIVALALLTTVMNVTSRTRLGL